MVIRSSIRSMRSIVRESVVEKNRVLKLGAVAAALSMVWLVVWGGELWQARRAFVRAQVQAERGLHALAAETLDGYRWAMVDRAERCKLLLTSYVQARRVDRIEWAAEACFEGGFNSYEVPIALSAHRELTGRSDEGIQILSSAAVRFDQIPDVYLALGQMLRRQKRDAEAVQAYQLAAARAGDKLQIILDSANYLASRGEWAATKPLADRLRPAAANNAEVKLFLARVYLKNGDSASSRELYHDALRLVGDQIEVKRALASTYADVVADAQKR